MSSIGALARAVAVAVPQRRVEPEPAPDRSTAMRTLSVFLTLLFLAILGLVVFQALLVQSQGRLDDLNTGITNAQGEAKRLRVNLADAESPDRILTTAKSRLGMIAPSEIGYLEPRETDDAKAALDPAARAKAQAPAPPQPTAPATTAPKTATTAPKTTTTAPKTTTTAPKTTTTAPKTTTTRPRSGR